jgi:uncharacterized protein (DUF1778 family)
MSSRVGVISVLTTLVLLAAWAADGRAQEYYGTGYYPYVGGGYGGYYGGYHSGTVAEGVLRGRAELVQAYGVASLYYAQALRQREEARSLLIENQLAVRTHYAGQQELLRQQLQEQRTVRRQRALRLAEERKAALTAAIDWPEELRGERYATARTEIEALARLHGDLGRNAGEATDLAVRYAIRELARQVMEDEQSHRLSDEQSKIVRQFVRGLSANVLHDTRWQPATESLAMHASR